VVAAVALEESEAMPIAEQQLVALAVRAVLLQLLAHQ
jgi:hypothetical protein